MEVLYTVVKRLHVITAGEHLSGYLRISGVCGLYERNPVSRYEKTCKIEG
jgi:hypothetical protein